MYTAKHRNKHNNVSFHMRKDYAPYRL